MTIQKYIETLKDVESMSGLDIAKKLGVSSCMVSTYRHNGYNPSLAVAKKVYLTDKVVLHPFSEEGLILEISKDKK